MKHLKKLGVLLFVLALALSVFAAPAKTQAANKKVTLNKTKVTLAVGKSVQLKLKNAPKGKTIKWSSNKKAIASVTKKGMVTAKKAGTAKITAALGKKKYTCTVKVSAVKTEKPGLKNTEGKNAAEVKVLAAIIEAQNAKGANIPDDLNDASVYVWDENGSLTQLNWWSCGITGALSLEGLSSLENVNLMSNSISSLDVSGNQAITEMFLNWNELSSLDVSQNTALQTFGCSHNQLDRLDVSNNTAITWMNCSWNKLDRLDVSNNSALEHLECLGNQLTSLDVSSNLALSELFCEKNQILSLDVSKNVALTSLACNGNQIASLDLTANTVLQSLVCDDAVAVTGYQGEYRGNGE